MKIHNGRFAALIFVVAPMLSVAAGPGVTTSRYSTSDGTPATLGTVLQLQNAAGTGSDAVDATHPLPVSVASGGGGAATIANGADVAEGSTTDAAATAGGTGTLSAKLRLATSLLDSLNTKSPTLANQTAANAALASILSAVQAVVPGATATCSSQTLAGTDVTAIASNAARLKFWISDNDAANVMNINYGAAATATVGSPLGPGQTRDESRYTGAIHIFGTGPISYCEVTP